MSEQASAEADAGLALAERPFYAERLEDGAPRPWTFEDLEDFAVASGDAFAGRLRPAAPPPDLALQLEASDDPSLYVGFDAGELDGLAGGLERLWRRFGIRPGELVAHFDYGASPTVLLASGTWTPHLARGAAERCGARVLCNDGVASFADRMLDVLTRLRPAALVLRRDVLAPLADVLTTAGVRLGEMCRWVAVSEPEGAPSVAELERFGKAFELAPRALLRADAAGLLLGDCTRCGAFHVDPALYQVEPLADDAVAVTARFARVCPSVRHRVERASLLPAGCPAEPDAARLAWV